MNNSIKIRKAEVKDSVNILGLIRKLARYEKLEQFVTADDEKIKQSIFCPDPHVRVFLAEYENQIVGQVIFFKNYSTFQAKPGIYIEDIFVLPEFRSKGIGSALFKEVVALAANEDCCKVEWCVLDWNKSAIDFYTNRNAEEMKEWKFFKLDSSKFNSILNN